MKFTSRGSETIEQVSKRMLYELRNWHVQFLYENTDKTEMMDYLDENNWRPLWTDDYWIVKNRPYNDWSGVPLEMAFKWTKSKELYEKDK